jgi:glycine dehydrogenase subunit 2
VILVPESAHGTNPATAAFAGYRVENIPATEDGRVDVAALTARLGPDVAGVMITNPNTCGLFEREQDDRRRGPRGGGYVYCDGANFNAIVGRVRPGDLGVDAMHINLHKTFSPARRRRAGFRAGRAVGSARALWPLPFTARQADGSVRLVEEESAAGIHPEASAGCARSMARWACSRARWPISSATARMGCGRFRAMRCSTPTTCCAG